MRKEKSFESYWLKQWITGDPNFATDGRVGFCHVCDESRFSLQNDSRRTLIWREPGSRHNRRNIVERDQYGGGGVMVWSGIMLNGRTDLHIFIGGPRNTVNARRYSVRNPSSKCHWCRRGVGYRTHEALIQYAMVDSRSHDVAWSAYDLEYSSHGSESDTDELECDGAGGHECIRTPDNSLSDTLRNVTALVELKDEKKNVQAFSNISVTSSGDVQLGNRSVYHGPVTINNYGVSCNDEQPTDTFQEPSKVQSPTDSHASKSSSPQEQVPSNIVQINHRSAPENDLGSTGEASGNGLIVTWLRELTKSRRCVLGAAASCMGLAVLLGILVLLVVNSKSRENIIPLQQVIAPYPQENDSGNLTIVRRNEWHAIPASNWKIENLIHPVECIVISHTASDICNTFDECADRARNIQRSHKEIRAWPDFGYNFLVGGDGYVYEGRGWDKEPAHPFQKIKNHISVNFIGQFDKQPAPDRQVLAARQLISEGVKLKKVAMNYDLLGLRQLAKTVSPGDKLFKQIQIWPHWTNSSQCMATINE
ncbi:peptidoglycan-recognition protein LC [Anabrus simplex]|uniref:peptidoglycan-recognition protein LC n=1 Tax=Anabrus simplex TaxID=316456 RepID=UPI0035A34B36